MKYSLGRVPSKFDIRDYKLSAYMPKGIKRTSLRTSRNWLFPKAPLDQKDTQHCVGFSIANFGINFPVYTNYTEEHAHKFYYLAKEKDGEPKQENGSTIRSAGEVMVSIGDTKVYAFAKNISEIKWWILNRGPMIAGTVWTDGMFEPDANNIIHPTGNPSGGHAYLLNEWTSDNYIGIQNSWGSEWGKNGKAYISATDFETIFLYDGEVITAIEPFNKR